MVESKFQKKVREAAEARAAREAAPGVKAAKKSEEALLPADPLVREVLKMLGTTGAEWDSIRSARRRKFEEAAICVALLKCALEAESHRRRELEPYIDQLLSDMAAVTNTARSYTKAGFVRHARAEPVAALARLMRKPIARLLSRAKRTTNAKDEGGASRKALRIYRGLIDATIEKHLADIGMATGSAFWRLTVGDLSVERRDVTEEEMLKALEKPPSRGAPLLIGRALGLGGDVVRLPE